MKLTSKASTTFNNQIEIYEQAKPIFLRLFGLENRFICRNGFAFISSILLVPSILSTQEGFVLFIICIESTCNHCLKFYYFKNSLTVIF